MHWSLPSGNSCINAALCADAAGISGSRTQRKLTSKLIIVWDGSYTLLRAVSPSAWDCDGVLQLARI